MFKKKKKQMLASIMIVIMMFGTLIPGMGLTVSASQTFDAGGVTLDVEDAEGNPMEGGYLELFEQPADNWPNNQPFNQTMNELNLDEDYVYSSQRIFQAEVEDGQTFIPNAYLLDGLSYEMIVSDYSWDSDRESALYHASFQAEDIGELSFLAEDLTPVSVDLDHEQEMLLSFRNQHDEIGVYPMYISTETELRVSSTDTMFGKIEVDQDSGDPESNRRYLDYRYESDLTEDEVILSPDPSEMVQVEDVMVNHRYPEFEDIFVSPGHRYQVAHLLEAGPYAMRAENVVTIDEDTAFEVGDTFTGEANYLDADVNSLEFHTEFRDDYGNRLQSNGDNPDFSDADYSFLSINEDDEIVKKTIDRDSREITDEEAVNEILSEVDTDRPLRFELLQDGDVYTEELTSFYNMEIDGPFTPGEYTLRVNDEHLDSLSIAFEETFMMEEEGFLELKMPDGLTLTDDWNNMVSVGQYRSDRDGFSAFQTDHHYDEEAINREELLSNMNGDDDYVLLVSGTMVDEAGHMYVYHFEEPITREELSEMESLDLRDLDAYDVDLHHEDGSFALQLINNDSYSGDYVGVYSNAPDLLNTVFTSYEQETYHVYRGEAQDQAITANTDGAKEITFSKEGDDVGVYGMRIYGDIPSVIYERDDMTNGVEALKTNLERFQVNPFKIMHAENDSPWLYEYGGYHRELDDYDTIAIPEDVFEEVELYNREFSNGNELEFRFGTSDLRLDSISVFREPNAGHDLITPFAESGPSEDDGYTGDFSDAFRVYSTLTVDDENGDRVGQYQDQNMFFDVGGLEDGTYTATLQVPTGPRESEQIERTFTVGEDDAVSASIQSPEDGSWVNDAEVTVDYTASDNVDLLVEAVNEAGEHVDERTGPGALNLGEDGAYTVQIRSDDAILDSVEIHLDTEAPDAPELSVEQSGNDLLLSWNEAEGAAHYDLSGGPEGDMTLIEAMVDDNEWTYGPVDRNATYAFEVTAVDRAGNEAASEVVTITTEDFAISDVHADYTVNDWGQLTIGDTVDVTVDGPANEGVEAAVELALVQDGSEETVSVPVERSDEEGQYRGTFTIEEGMEELKDVTAFFTDGEGNETDPVSVTIDRPVGANFSTVLDNVREGDELRLRGARTVRGSFDADGHVSFEGLPAGSYTVDLIASGYTDNGIATVTLDAGMVKADADVDYDALLTEDVTITLTNDETIDTIDRLSLDNWGLYNDGVSSSLAYWFDRMIDVEDNELVIPNRPVSDGYQLNLSVDGYGTINETLDLTEETAYSFELTPAASVEGHVTDAETGSSIVGATIQVRNQDGSFFSGFDRTGSGGAFEIMNLPGDRLATVTASYDGYQSEEKTVDLSDADESLTFELTESGYIEGQVVDADYEPVDREWLNLFEDGRYQGFTQSDQNGDFRFNGVEGDGPFEIRAGEFQVDGVEPRDDVYFVLTHPGEGAFSGAGTELTPDEDVVLPGDDVTFTLSYENESDEDLTNVVASLESERFTFTDETIDLGDVDANASGEVTFTATVNEEATRTSTVTVSLTHDQETDETDQVRAQVTPLTVTAQAPAVSASDEIQVRGTTASGAHVTITDGEGNELAVLQDADRNWSETVTVPDADLVDGSSHEIHVQAELMNVKAEADAVTVDLQGDFPSLKEASYSVWGNEDIDIDLGSGIARHAIMELSVIEMDLAFDGPVDDAAVRFIGEEATLTGDGESFSGDVTESSWTSSGQQMMEVVYTVDGVTIVEPILDVTVLIDPAGYVFEGTMENRIEGVTAIVEEFDGTDSWSAWDARSAGQENPQITGDDGRFQWDVPEGLWRVNFEHPDFEPLTSRNVPVPPPELELNLPMVAIENPELEDVDAPEEESEASTSFTSTLSFSQLMDLDSVKDHITLVAVDEEGNETDVSLSYSYDEAYGASEETVRSDVDIYGEAHDISYWNTDESIKLIDEITVTASLDYETDYAFTVSDEIVNYGLHYDGANTLEAGYETSFTTESRSTGGSGGGAPPVTEDPEEPVEEEGSVDTDRETGEDGRTIVNAAISADHLDQDADALTLAIDSTDEEQVLVTMAQADFAAYTEAQPYGVIEIQSGLGSVYLTAEILNDLQGDLALELTPAEVSLDGMSMKSNAVSYSLTANGDAVTAFDTPVRRSLTLTEGVDFETATVVQVHDDGTVTGVATHFEDSAATFRNFSNSTYVVIEDAQAFGDVTEADWSKDYVESLASKRVINGFPNDGFRPDQQTTRAQFAALVTRAFGLGSQAYDGDFSDVASTDWYADELASAVAYGIVEGRTDGSFDPDADVSRQEAALMMARALELAGYEGDRLNSERDAQHFSDSEAIADWAVEGVDLIAQAEIMQGNTNQAFLAEEAITRREIAATLTRSLQFNDWIN